VTTDKSRKPIPPYISYRSFRNFIDGLQLGIPARIDRSYWGDRYSGSTGTQLMAALRFLGLIDNTGSPLTRMRQLVSAKGAQKSEALRQIGLSAFSALLEKSLDPQLATYSQLEEAFYSTYQVSGDVARKCIKFFISLESDAGVVLSPYIMKKSKPTRAAGGRKQNTAKTSARTNRNVPVPPAPDPIPTRANWHEMVLTKFPTFDPAWSDDVKIKWFEAFDSLLEKGLTSGVEK
jgi:hypothetical protein